MAGTWINRVRHVNDGEAVNGAIDSRPTRALEGNTQYLKNRIDSAELGEGVLAYGETVEPDAQVGMAVYRRNDTARYERALAAVEPDPASGVLVPTASSDTVGIIVFKYNATKADILLSGRQLVDISHAVDGAPVGAAPAGRYYLSSFTAGMLVQQRPPVSVSVLIYTDDGYAIVQPVMRDFLEDHIHYKVQLVAQPAGTNIVGGGIHTVGLPNPALPGWLPANHAIFNGRAPTGAAFGYNLSQHPKLARIFPPIPASGAVIFLDRGENYLGGSLIPMGTNGLCSVDTFGIWWMSNCQGDAPWPETWTTPVLELPPNTSAGPECPRLEEFQIILSYTMMVFTTQRTAVTSLQPAIEGGPLTFTNCDGEEATTGDLYAGLDLAFLVDPANDTTGYLAFKVFDTDTETFKLGPVVEGLTTFAGSGCTLTSSHPVVQPDNSVLHQGTVQVSLDTAAGERELPADLIRLDQTDERYYLDIPYIGFDAGPETSLRMRFYVPTAGLPSNPANVAIRLQLLGRSAGTLPALTLTRRILHRPTTTDGMFTPLATNLPGLAFESLLAITTTLPIGADQYIEVNSAQFPVAAGDTILVTLTRNTNDGYAGEVGLMRPVGVLTGTTL